jgi:chromosome segregation ATPase
MAALFKKQPKSEPSLEELPEVLQQLLQRLQEERAALEGVLEQAQAAAQQSSSVEQQMAAAAERQAEHAAAVDRKLDEMAERQAKQTAEIEEQLTDLLQRLDAARAQAVGLSDLAGRLEQLDGAIGEVERSRAQAAQGVKEVAQNLSDVSGVADSVRGSLQEANRLQDELAQLSGPSGAIAELSGKADEVREQFLNFNHDANVAREALEAMRRDQGEVQSGFDQAREAAARLKQEVDGAEARLATMEAGLAEVAKLEQRTTRTEEQLQALSSLSDHVLHKTRTLEGQREVVDRAAAQAARLDDLVWDLDSRLKKLQEDSKLIKKTQDSLADLEQLVERSTRRIESAKAQDAAARQEAEQLASQLSSLKSDVREGVDRLQLDRQGLEATSRQVGELRSTLTELESRFQQMERAGRVGGSPHDARIRGESCGGARRAGTRRCRGAGTDRDHGTAGGGAHRAARGFSACDGRTRTRGSGAQGVGRSGARRDRAAPRRAR